MRWAINADKFLTEEQVATLVSYLKDRRDLAVARGGPSQAIRDYYAVRTLLETGLRVAEFCLTVNADFSGLRLVVRRGKGGKPRTVLLTRPAANSLKEWLLIKPTLGHSIDGEAPLFPSRYNRAYTTRGVQQRVKLAFAEAGLPAHFSVHSLRHTNCTLLLAKGVALPRVRDNLGHHSLSVTNLYAHASGELDSGLDLCPSSEKAEFSEVEIATPKRRKRDVVRAMLSKANFKE